MNTEIGDRVRAAACKRMHDRSGVVWRTGAHADVYDERAFAAGFQFSEFVLEVRGVIAFDLLVFSGIC